MEEWGILLADFHIRWSWYNIARMYNLKAAEFDGTMAIGYALLNIDKEGTPSTKLGPKMGMEPRSLTRMIKSLEKKGFIEKRHDKEIKDYTYIEYSSIVQHVNQDLLGSLNPKIKIKDILFDLNKLIKKNKDVFNNLIFQYLQKLNLNPKVLDLYPIQLSGGQRQRILIVKSLLWSPKFLIMDEPVSSLDPYVQIEIIDIIKKLKIERNLTLLVISHDINFIKKICERVCILENGQIIEDGDVEEIINFPKHKYTKNLLIN